MTRALYWSGMGDHAANTVHVRGLSGEFEREEAVTKLLSRCGPVERVTCRRRAKSKGGTWALVVMEDAAGADRAFNATIMAGETALKITRYDPRTAKRSTGGMVAVQGRDAISAKRAGTALRYLGLNPTQMEVEALVRRSMPPDSRSDDNRLKLPRL